MIILGMVDEAIRKRSHSRNMWRKSVKFEEGEKWKKFFNKNKIGKVKCKDKN